MIKSFTYTNTKGQTSTRVCNVVHESPTEIMGFDYNKLNPEEQAIVNKVFASDRKPTPVPAVHATPGNGTLDYDDLGISRTLFVKAYRCFKKANMK